MEKSDEESDKNYNDKKEKKNVMMGRGEKRKKNYRKNNKEWERREREVEDIRATYEES